MSSQAAAAVVEVLIMGGCAALLFVFAWLIGVKKKLGLIAGYNDRTASRVSDPDGLARMVARLCLLAGLACLAMPVLRLLFGETRTGFWGVVGGFLGFLVALVLFAALMGPDYTRKPR